MFSKDIFILCKFFSHVWQQLNCLLWSFEPSDIIFFSLTSLFQNFDEKESFLLKKNMLFERYILGWDIVLVQWSRMYLMILFLIYFRLKRRYTHIFFWCYETSCLCLNILEKLKWAHTQLNQKIYENEHKTIYWAIEKTILQICVNFREPII